MHIFVAHSFVIKLFIAGAGKPFTHLLVFRTSIHWADLYSLTARSREVSKPRDSGLYVSNRFEIWQAPRQQFCRVASQISKRHDHYNMQSRGFETSLGLALGRLIA